MLQRKCLRAQLTFEREKMKQKNRCYGERVYEIIKEGTKTGNLVCDNDLIKKVNDCSAASIRNVRSAMLRSGLIKLGYRGEVKGAGPRSKYWMITDPNLNIKEATIWYTPGTKANTKTFKTKDTYSVVINKILEVLSDMNMTFIRYGSLQLERLKEVKELIEKTKCK